MCGPRNTRQSPRRFLGLRRKTPTLTVNFADAARRSDGLQPYPKRDRYWRGIAGLLPIRHTAPGRREPDDLAVGGAQDPAGIAPEWCAELAAIQRSSDRARPRLPPLSLRARCRGHRVEAHQWPISARPAHVAENQMPQS